MKAEITKDGYIKITAETINEAFAMKGLNPVGTLPCEVCGQMRVNLIFDCSVLLSSHNGFPAVVVDPSAPDNCITCPTCGGVHFNVTNGKTLVCTNVTTPGRIGCGWRGQLETMKLFGYRPHGFGQSSLFVMAENEEKAKAAVENKISELTSRDEPYKYDEYPKEDRIRYSKYDFEGFGTEKYELFVVGPEEVVLNSNS